MIKTPSEEFRLIIKEPDQQTINYRYIGNGYDANFEENIYQYVDFNEFVRRHVPKAGITRWVVVDTWV